MTFLDLAKKRESCRSYDSTREVEREKLSAILEAARLSPSACNSQPYHLYVVTGEKRGTVAKACMGMGMNPFMKDAPVLLVITEREYNKTAAFGAKIKHNDYRSIDIGLLAAHITFAAADLGLGSCMLGWFDDAAVREVCRLDKPVRLVITLGYPLDAHREKKRKELDKLVSEVE